METGVIVAISVVLFIAVFAVLVCIFGSVAGTVSSIKHTNDEDTSPALFLAPLSRGLGRGPLKAETRVRIPSELLFFA